LRVDSQRRLKHRRGDVGGQQLVCCKQESRVLGVEAVESHCRSSTHIDLEVQTGPGEDEDVSLLQYFGV